MLLYFFWKGIHVMILILIQTVYSVVKAIHKAIWLKRPIQPNWIGFSNDIKLYV